MIEAFTTGYPHQNTNVITAEIESGFVTKDDLVPFRCSPVPSCAAPLQTEGSTGGCQLGSRVLHYRHAIRTFVVPSDNMNGIISIMEGRSAAVAECSRYWIVAGLVTSSSPVPLNTRHVGQRCTVNLSTAQTYSRCCGVVVRRGDTSSGVIHVT
ncbi:uncharacterized protein TNCV_3020521 [Trichonephila clavipes]|nr:uncharacterized protein TNCV_3020521 [Trichonephila clavipes]